MSVYLLLGAGFGGLDPKLARKSRTEEDHGAGWLRVTNKSSDYSFLWGPREHRRRLRTKHGRADAPADVEPVCGVKSSVVRTGSGCADCHGNPASGACITRRKNVPLKNEGRKWKGGIIIAGVTIETGGRARSRVEDRGDADRYGNPSSGVCIMQECFYQGSGKEVGKRKGRNCNREGSPGHESG